MTTLAHTLALGLFLLTGSQPSDTSDKRPSSENPTPQKLSDPIENSEPPYQPLFSDIRAPQEKSLDPGRFILSLPGEIAELPFLPLYPVLNALEHFKILERAFALFTNEELTFAGLPIVEPFSSSGLGFGLLLAWNEPLGGPDRVLFFSLARLNGDRDLSLSIGRRVPPLSGRVLEMSAAYSINRDQNWFGLGSDQNLSSQRLIRVDELSAFVGLSELFPQVINIDGAFQFGFRSRGLFPGSGPIAPALTVSETEILAPPGFGRTINYVESLLRFRYDTRDGEGRITRGIVWSVEGNTTVEVPNGRPPTSGGLLGTTQLVWFIPILPRNRVLVFTAGASGAARILNDGQVALHQLVNLGGANTLRGYQPDRFIDRLGWWGSAEYRFLLSNYGGSLVGFSGTIFADIGRVAGRGRELFTNNIPWSVGLGIRAETDFILLGRFQVAYSPEGFQVTIGFGESF